MLPVCKNVSKISFGAKDIDVLEWKGDLLAVGVTEKDVEKDENSKFKNPILNKMDSRLGGLLSEASAEEDFTGKAGQSTVLKLLGLGTKRVGLIGLGQSALTVSAFRGLGEAVASAAKASQAKEVAISLASAGEHSTESKPNIASAIASGTCLILVYEYVDSLMLYLTLNFCCCLNTLQGLYLGYLMTIDINQSPKSLHLNLWKLLALDLDLKWIKS